MVRLGVFQMVKRDFSRVRILYFRIGYDYWKKEYIFQEVFKFFRFKCQQFIYWRRGRLEFVEGRGFGQQVCFCFIDVFSFKGSFYFVVARLSMIFLDKIFWFLYSVNFQYLAFNLSLRDFDYILFFKVGDLYVRKDSMGVYVFLEREFQLLGYCCVGVVFFKIESFQG